MSTAMPTTSRARKYTCGDLGVCNSTGNCVHCTDAQPAFSAADELPVPTILTEQQDQPLGTWEAIFLYGSIGTCGVLTIIVMAGTLGWLYGAFGA